MTARSGEQWLITLTSYKIVRSKAPQQPKLSLASQNEVEKMIDVVRKDFTEGRLAIELRTHLAALFALLISVFSAAFCLGLSIQSHEETLRTGITFAPDHGGRDIYLEMSVLQLGIAVNLLIFLLVLRFGQKLWSRVFAMSLLLLLLIQAWLLIGVKPARLPLSVTNYSNSLQVIWYFDFVLVLLSVVTALMYGYLVWMVVKNGVEAKSR